MALSYMQSYSDLFILLWYGQSKVTRGLPLFLKTKQKNNLNLWPFTNVKNSIVVSGAGREMSPAKSWQHCTPRENTARPGGSLHRGPLRDLIGPKSAKTDNLAAKTRWCRNEALHKSVSAGRWSTMYRDEPPVTGWSVPAREIIRSSGTRIIS